MSTQELVPVVLVPGFWLGSWAWDEVAPLLVERGHDVTSLTLPGLESDPGERREGVGLDDHVEAIVRALDEHLTNGKAA